MREAPIVGGLRPAIGCSNRSTAGLVASRCASTAKTHAVAASYRASPKMESADVLSAGALFSRSGGAPRCVLFGVFLLRTLLHTVGKALARCPSFLVCPCSFQSLIGRGPVLRCLLLFRARICFR